MRVQFGHDIRVVLRLSRRVPTSHQLNVESRLRPLQPQGDSENAVSMTLLADSVESWNTTFEAHAVKIKVAEDRMKEASSPDMSVPELQRRLRALVSEVDSARNALTKIEDDTIAELAAVLGLDPSHPRVERLRIERVVTASNIDWRKIPMGSLMKIDREATIDVPTAFAQAKLSPEASAITDAAIIDAAVALVESSDRLRTATIDALRSFVLNMKKMTMEFKFDEKDQVASEERLREILAAATKSVEPTVRARVAVQQELLHDTCLALASDDVRELKNAYWRFAYPEIFYDRHPADDMFDQMMAELPANESRGEASGTRRRLGHQTALGRRGVPSLRGARLHRDEHYDRRERSRTGEVRVPTGALKWSRPFEYRRGQLRAHRWRALSESARLRALHAARQCR